MSTQIPGPPTTPIETGPINPPLAASRRFRWPLIAGALAVALVMPGVLLFIGVEILAAAGKDTPFLGTSDRQGARNDRSAKRSGSQDLPQLPHTLSGYTLASSDYTGHGNDPGSGTTTQAVMATYTRDGKKASRDKFTVLVSTGMLERNAMTLRVPDSTKACHTLYAKRKSQCSYYSTSKSIVAEQSGTLSTATAERALNEIYNLY